MVYVDHLGHLYMTNLFAPLDLLLFVCFYLFWDITEKQLFLADVKFLSQKKPACGCEGILLSVNMTSTNVSSSLPSHYSPSLSPLPPLGNPIISSSSFETQTSNATPPIISVPPAMAAQLNQLPLSSDIFASLEANKHTTTSDV